MMCQCPCQQGRYIHPPGQCPCAMRSMRGLGAGERRTGVGMLIFTVAVAGALVWAGFKAFENAR